MRNNRRLPRPPVSPSNTTAICGDGVTLRASEEEIRFLLVSRKPLQEPVAWYGPIVMNTQAELQQAARELRDGTFIKSA